MKQDEKKEISTEYLLKKGKETNEIKLAKKIIVEGVTMENKCVICGAELPEGYGHVCKNCENAVNEEVNPLEEVKKRISFSYGENPCIRIKDSYLIKSNEDIKATLEYIRGLDEYKKLKEVGYSRTPNSEFHEWKGHNVLYKLGYQRSRTCSVDIDQKEPKWRRFIYAILSIF